MTLERFHALRSLIANAYEWKDYPLAQFLAEEYLQLAEQFPEDSNYGNALHDAPLYLGKIALKGNKIALAKASLLQAGQTPGSPQLRSDGPNTSLARELLIHQEVETVLEYLSLVQVFWKGFYANRRVKKWRKQIEEGRIPDFGPNEHL